MICQAQFWGDFPTWVQAICAIGTFVFAVIVWLQGNKIAELSQIAEQQTKQTQILSDMLAHTLFEHFQKTAPKFQVASQSRGLRYANYQLRVLNSAAILRSFQSVPSGFLNINSPDIGRTVNPGREIELRLSLNNDNSPDHFEIFITYSNDDNEQFLQRGIIRVENRINIKLDLLSIRPFDPPGQ